MLCFHNLCRLMLVAFTRIHRTDCFPSRFDITTTKILEMRLRASYKISSESSTVTPAQKAPRTSDGSTLIIAATKAMPKWQGYFERDKPLAPCSLPLGSALHAHGWLWFSADMQVTVETQIRFSNWSPCFGLSLRVCVGLHCKGARVEPRRLRVPRMLFHHSSTPELTRYSLIVRTIMHKIHNSE